MFESTFDTASSVNDLNTKPPSCNMVGMNAEGTTAYSCVN